MRFREALDYALARATDGDMTYEEAMHELGISTREAGALIAEVNAAATSQIDGVTLGLYVGMLIGKGLER